jgi:hypothetical protein
VLQGFKKRFDELVGVNLIHEINDETEKLKIKMDTNGKEVQCKTQGKHMKKRLKQDYGSRDPNLKPQVIEKDIGRSKKDKLPISDDYFEFSSQHKNFIKDYNIQQVFLNIYN